MAGRVTVPVEIIVQVPADLEDSFHWEVSKDPTSLDRAILYWLTRRTIQTHSREKGVAE